MSDLPISNAKCCWCDQHLVQFEAAWWCPTESCRKRQREHGLGRQVGLGRGKGTKWQWLYVPTPKQVEFDACPAKYVLYGGAAGPGKSHAARWALYRRALRIPGYEALLLRKTFPELEKTHLRRMAREAELIGGDFVESKRIMKFANGSLIECGHMEDADAVAKYLSSEYDAIVPDEGSTFDPAPLLELSTRARSSKPTVVAEGGAKFWIVSNPGGPASHTLLDFFIDHAPDFDVYPNLRAKYQPVQWRYISGTLDDNPYLDPDYEASLAVTSKWRYEQLRHGDWRVFEGQFFSQWHEREHVVALEPSREGTQWFRSLDWGRNQPGCCVWWAILPDHQMYIRKDWKFQGMDEPEVAAGIKAIDTELGLTKISYTAADPAIFNKTGATHTDVKFVGQSIGESLNHYGLKLIKADNDRFNGWGRCHALLRPSPDGTPWLRVHPDCRYLIRSIAGAVSDPKDPDDLDTDSDDHACLLADTLIATDRGERPLVDLRAGDRVWTRQGLRRVTRIEQTGDTRELWHLVTSTGRVLRGTANHPIWTAERGFVRFDEIRYGDILDGWAATSRISTDQREPHGVGTVDRFQSDTTSTTKTGIRETTPSTTWRAYRGATILAITQRVASRARSRLSALCAMLRNGISRLLDVSGTALTPALCGADPAKAWTSSATFADNTSKTYLWRVAADFVPTPASQNGDAASAWTTSTGGASSVAQISWSIGTIPPAPVQAPAPIVVAVFKRDCDPVPVFNLSVERAHEYYAHGLLVHNCDAWRYGAMSRPHPLSKSKGRRTYPAGTMGALRQESSGRSMRLGTESTRAAVA